MLRAALPSQGTVLEVASSAAAAYCGRLLRDLGALSIAPAELARRLANLKVGESDRIPVDGDDMFILIQCYEARPREKGRFEAHQVEERQEGPAAAVDVGDDEGSSLSHEGSSVASIALL